MTISYSQARARLAELWDKAVEDREPITIQRRGREDVVLLPAAELAAMETSLHLLSSPTNARRLFAALEESDREGGERVSPADLDRLRAEAEDGAAVPSRP